MTITKTIGSAGGRDYSTIAAFEAALPATLADAYIGSCYNDSEFTVTSTIVFAGFTTTSSFTVLLTAASGQSFIDNAGAATNPLKYDAAKGVGIRYTSSYNKTIEIQVDYVSLSRLQIAKDNGGIVYDNSVLTVGTGNGRNTTQCIFQQNGNSSVEALKIRNSLHTNGLLIVNGTGSDGVALPYLNANTKFVNFGVVRCSDKTASGSGFVNPQGTSTYPKIANCNIFGFTNAVSNNDSSHATGSNNCSDKTIGWGSSNQASKTYANQFVGTASSGMDFRLKSGADAIGIGVVDTTDIPSGGDILGTSRGLTWDAGPYQSVSGVSLIAAAAFKLRGAAQISPRAAIAGAIRTSARGKPSLAGTTSVSGFIATKVGVRGSVGRRIPLAGLGRMRTVGQATPSGATSLSALAGMVSSARGSISAAALLSGTSSLSIRGKSAATAITYLASRARFSVSAAGTVVRSTALAGLAAIRAVGRGIISGPGALSAVATIRMMGRASVAATTSLTGRASAKVSAKPVLTGPGALNARASMRLSATAIVAPSVSLRGRTSIRATSRAPLTAAVGLAGRISTRASARASVGIGIALTALSRLRVWAAGLLTVSGNIMPPLDDAGFIDATAAETYVEATPRTIYVPASNRWRP